MIKLLPIIFILTGCNYHFAYHPSDTPPIFLVAAHQPATLYPLEEPIECPVEDIKGEGRHDIDSQVDAIRERLSIPEGEYLIVWGGGCLNGSVTRNGHLSTYLSDQPGKHAEDRQGDWLNLMDSVLDTMHNEH